MAMLHCVARDAPLAATRAAHARQDAHLFTYALPDLTIRQVQFLN
jgi:hypothetical protein